MIFTKFTAAITKEKNPRLEVEAQENSGSIKLGFTFKNDPGKPMIDSLRKALDIELKGKCRFDYQLNANPVKDGFRIEIHAHSMDGSKIPSKMTLNTLKRTSPFEA